MRPHRKSLKCRQREAGPETTAGHEGSWIPGRKLCEGVRQRWIGMPCRVKLDIYLVGYGREGQKGRSWEKWGETEAASLWERQKRMGLRLEAEDQLALVDEGGVGMGECGLSLKGTGQIITARTFESLKAHPQ